MPYLRCYEEVLIGENIPYDIFYWDRYDLKEEKENAFAFRRLGMKRGTSLLPGYLAYRRFLLKFLNSESYIVFIVLTSQMSVLLYDFLRSRRFILDIRDYSHENLLPYRLALCDLINRADLVCISSRGFTGWLPKTRKYVLSHNLISGELKNSSSPFDAGQKIVSYIGAVSYFNANLEFINIASKVKGIEIRYVGKGTCEKDLEEYCRMNQIHNVSFYGQYNPEEKGKYYDETNFVIGYYGNDTMTVKTLVPNRLYESCIYRRPIIVNSGSYLSDVVTNHDLGIVIDLTNKESLAEKMARYYESEYYAHYVKCCDRYLKMVGEDITVFRNEVLKTLMNEGYALGK